MNSFLTFAAPFPLVSHSITANERPIRDPPRMVAAKHTISEPSVKGDLLRLVPIGKDLNMTEVVLGSMTWGAQISEEDAHDQLDYAYERGVVGIDSAEMYPAPPTELTSGATERIIGSWIKKRGGPSFRDNLVLCSKVAGPSHTTRVFPWIRGPNRCLDRKNIRESVHNTLKRLGTDYIDLMQIHWPDRYVPMFGNYGYDISKASQRVAVSFEEQVHAFDELIKEGKIRNYGLSNETAWGVSQFHSTATAHGYAQPVSIQNSYNLLCREFEESLAEACAPHNANIALLAYSPLAGGALTGKYLTLPVPEQARYITYPHWMKRFHNDVAREAMMEYKRIADDVGLPLITLSLAWCKSRWFVGSSIVGATSVKQLEENIECFSVNLDSSVIEALENIYTRYRNPYLIS